MSLRPALRLGLPSSPHLPQPLCTTHTGPTHESGNTKQVNTTNPTTLPPKLLFRLAPLFLCGQLLPESFTLLPAPPHLEQRSPQLFETCSHPRLRPRFLFVLLLLALLLDPQLLDE